MSAALSLDLETMSLKPNAMILQIGAVVFDTDKIQSYKDIHATSTTFDLVLDQADQQKKFGRHFCHETANWWLKQDALAQEMLFGAPCVSFDVAIQSFDTWVRAQAIKHGIRDVWVKGNRDGVWIEDAFEAAGYKFPIHYRGFKCIRTLASAVGTFSETPPGAVAHNALSDALVQAMLVQRTLSKLSQWRRADAERNSQVAKMAA